ncbi:MAG: dihydrodipicolinate synthase family protein [Spirochaetales bacterium]|jgi:4-hydroxy-tetrahydrodipicolinate synthase|nr:dihydrodipicolinate synthase family protein [Spirochaetales bacterium]
MLKAGFYTAVGTPLNNRGEIVLDSLMKEIEDQISAGASGLLLYGTMGMGGCVKTSEYERGVNAAIEAVGKKCVLLIGASENSLARVEDKLEILEDKEIDGVVMTAPYYFKVDDPTLLNFFRKTAEKTSKDYYLYDIPFTKHKLTLPMVLELYREGLVKGIKSGDLVLIKQVSAALKGNDDFTPIFSGSDLFDVAEAYGVNRYLDGIFACVPRTIREVQESFNRNDPDQAKDALRRMMDFRDALLGIGIWPSFSYVMNLLGYEGNFAPDYERSLSDTEKSQIKTLVSDLGEI